MDDQTHMNNKTEAGGLRGLGSYGGSFLVDLFWNINLLVFCVAGLLTAFPEDLLHPPSSLIPPSTTLSRFVHMFYIMFRNLILQKALANPVAFLYVDGLQGFSMMHGTWVWMIKQVRQTT